MIPDLFAEPGAGGQLVELPDAELYYFPAFLAAESDAYLADLQASLAWRQQTIVVYGREYPEPRLSAWYGDPDAHYTYSGIHHRPLAWTDTLQRLKSRVEAVAGGVVFNSVLANLYRHGADGVAWHSDDEPELGPEPVIASVTLGQVRPFQLRHRTRPELRYRILLEHGSLLVMRGSTQRCWQHQIPKSARPLQPRLNLTFRVVR